MSLWGKTYDKKPKHLKLDEDGVTVAHDASGKKLVLIDSEEALATANKELGITSPGWYLVQKTNTRTKVELLITLASVDRQEETEEEIETETDLGITDPDSE